MRAFSYILAYQAETLLQSARAWLSPSRVPASSARSISADTAPAGIGALAAAAIYRGCLQRWHIPERFPQPDWSIVDWSSSYPAANPTPLNAVPPQRVLQPRVNASGATGASTCSIRKPCVYQPSEFGKKGEKLDGRDSGRRLRKGGGGRKKYFDVSNIEQPANPKL